MNANEMAETSTRWSGSNHALSIMSVSAWATLGMVVLGGILSIPTIAAPMQAARPGTLLHIASTAVSAAAAVILFVLWGSALWYAWNDRSQKSMPRSLLIVLLLIGNFVAAFFYYFGFVLWSTRRHA